MPAQTSLISFTGQTVTMTSLGMVEYINSQRKKGEPELQHKHFLAKVLQVLGEETSAIFLADLPDSYGRSRRGYRFPKREACLMAMSYSYDLQAKVFDRMTALEVPVENQAARPHYVTSAFGRIGHVYLIESTCGTRIKIGRTSRPEKRVNHIKHMHGGHGRVFVTFRLTDMCKVESGMHKAFSSHRGCGEWFAVEFDAAKGALEAMSAGLEVSDAYLAEQKARKEAKRARAGDILVDRFFSLDRKPQGNPDATATSTKPIEAAAATFKDLHAVATGLSVSPNVAAAMANQGALKLTGINLLGLLGQEQLAKPDSKCSIRSHMLNDGDDTPVFRAEDVCKAAGALDYFIAMRAVSDNNVVTFAHPETGEPGTGYACVTWEGALQILRRTDNGVLSDDVVETLDTLARIREEMLAT